MLRISQWRFSETAGFRPFNIPASEAVFSRDHILAVTIGDERRGVSAGDMLPCGRDFDEAKCVGQREGEGTLPQTGLRLRLGVLGAEI